MKQNAGNYSVLWAAYFMAGFPLFYFVYKFGNPMFGTNDFFSYYKLYRDWDIANVEAPFNMRLLGSYIVYLINSTGLHYDTKTVFDQFGLDRNVFFNAVFFNYLCVVTTCVLIFRLVRTRLGGMMLPFLSGLLYFLGFGTIFYEIMPITDALSVMLFAIVLSCYLARSYLILIPLSLLIIQREYVFMALGLVALLDFARRRDKYHLWVMVMCVFCFGVYYALRKTVFYTPMYDHQASAGYFMESLLRINFPLGQYARQTLLTLNLYLIYLGVYFWKTWKGHVTDRAMFWNLFFLFLQINIISFAAVFGNNTGRYFYIVVPMVIYQLALELKPFLPEAALSGK